MSQKLVTFSTAPRYLRFRTIVDLFGNFSFRTGFLKMLYVLRIYFISFRTLALFSNVVGLKILSKAKDNSSDRADHVGLIKAEGV